MAHGKDVTIEVCRLVVVEQSPVGRPFLILHYEHRGGMATKAFCESARVTGLSVRQ